MCDSGSRQQYANGGLRVVAGIGDLDDFGSLSNVPSSVRGGSTKKQTDKPRITVMYELSCVVRICWFTTSDFAAVDLLCFTRFFAVIVCFAYSQHVTFSTFR